MHNLHVSNISVVMCFRAQVYINDGFKYERAIKVFYMGNQLRQPPKPAHIGFSQIIRVKFFCTAGIHIDAARWF